MVARFSFSIFSAASFDGALPASSMHTRCVSSWSRRSSPAWPSGLKEAFSIAVACAEISSLDGAIAQPSGRSARATIRTFPIIFIVAPLALDGRRIERRTVGVARKEHRERDGRIRSENQLGKALLPEA